jgi:mitogen-activated protein kinase 6
MTMIVDGAEMLSKAMRSAGVEQGMSTTNQWSIMGEAFELPDNLRVVEYLGAGAYGVVCAAHDHNTDTTLAIKKCKQIFQSRTLAKRTLREIRLLRLMQHDNIVQIKSILLPSDIESFDCLYVVFELMETDLAQIIRSTQSLRDQHTQYFMQQLLQGLDYLHQSGIVHRDLK